MPFTLAHPAAAIGSGRFGLVPSAVVAGALAPDVFYYLPGAVAAVVPGSDLVHRPAGLPTINLAVGLALVAMWRIVLRRPMIDLLPQPLRDAARCETAGPVVRTSPLLAAVRDLVTVVISVLVGVASHLLLDLVSHDSMAGGEFAALLGQPLAGQPLHLVLQVTLSLVGLVALAWWGRAWQRDRRGGRPLTWSTSSLLTLGAVLFAAAVGAVAGVVRAGPVGRGATATQVVIESLLGAVSAGAAVVLAYTAVWWAVRAWRISRGRPPRRPAVPARSPAARPPSRTAG